MKSIAVVIPTRNERIHIIRCVQALSFATQIYLLDSQSTDETCSIASAIGCIIWNYPSNILFSEKINDALFRLRSYDLVMRVDADEVVSPELSCSIARIVLSEGPVMPAYSVTRRLTFFSHALRWGGTVTNPIRLYNPKYISLQKTRIDEHVNLNGFASSRLKGQIYDSPLHGYSHWLYKHIRYSEHELISQSTDKLFGQKPLFTRFYYRFPPLVRPFILFIYRYFFLFGFLDGMPGLYYHISQTLIYRLIVDIRISSKLSVPS
jgi:glycosyltransferase involved in cell wall biosynthesis